MSEINRITNLDNTYKLNTGKTNKKSNADFSSYLGESQSLNNIFNKAADKYGVPVNLIKAIGKAESGFNKNAVSRCGAQGIMQLMPATARALGVSDSFDAEQNIMGGAKYISGLLKKYNGNTTIALAAYNAGGGNVAKYGGVPPFSETQNYVKKVTEYMIQAGGTSQSSDSQVSQNSQTSTQPKTNYPGLTFVGYPFQSNSDADEISSADHNENSLSNLISEFSYNDYLTFLDTYFKDSDDENKEAEDNTNLNSFKNINYNAPVMNLINSQM